MISIDCKVVYNLYLSLQLINNAMKRDWPFIITIFSFFINVLSIQAQWQQITGIPFTSGHCIDAIGDNFAVVGGNNKIFITTDAGKTWNSKSLPLGTAVDLSITDTYTFYVASDYGSFYKTIDGGNNWSIIYFNPSRSLFGNYIEMFNQYEGIAMGDSMFPANIPLFLRVQDGVNWVETTQQSVGGGAANGWLSLDFVNSNIGYYSPRGGPAPIKLFKTTNGGINWIETNFDVYANVLKFYNEDYGLLATAPNIYMTKDGGTNWNKFSIGAPKLYYCQDLEFVPNNPSKVWMSNYYGLLFSSDSGKTWKEQNIPNITSAFDIEFSNEKIGWLLCTNGNLFYTSNCGGFITDIDIEKDLLIDFNLEQNYPNPFNPVTKIKFSIPKQNFVTLKVYDILGKEIETLVSSMCNTGNYSIDFDGFKYSNGIYFYTIIAGEYTETKKMILLK